MIRNLNRLTGALALSLWAGSSTADESWLGYIDWLTANSDFEYNGEPLPTVEYRSQAMLQLMAYGDQRVAQAEYEGRELNIIEGVYDDYVMYLPDDVETPEYVIVHELVHYLQDINDVTDDCIPANEPIAYLLHHKWAEENGYVLPQGNLLFGMMLGMACREQYGYLPRWTLLNRDEESLIEAVEKTVPISVGIFLPEYRKRFLL